ncbi:MAG: serine/threonine protein kinase, partial [Myxococcales bacterium]|nr:serine/threonine protein kinase [Myxococcales bacterium]
MTPKPQPLTDASITKLEAGTRVDHFRLVRYLGKGGTAVVYLARDSKLGRRVALKMVRPSYAASPEARAAFLHEARATARFNHPNIVAIHFVSEWRGIPYVALEYLEGHTLRQRVGERPLGAAEATRTGLAIARALDVAHGAGIAHADLKPENVLIPPDGRVRVVDFGLARVVGRGEEGGADRGPHGGEDADADDDADSDADSARDAGEASARGDHGDGDDAAELALAMARPTERRPRRVVTGQRVQSEAPKVQGTPAYMAPEQWRGQAVSGATDIWAL